MYCKDCNSTLRSDTGLSLECERCGYPPFDCNCDAIIGYTPNRVVHCTSCGRNNIALVDTSSSGWRDKTV